MTVVEIKLAAAAATALYFWWRGRGAAPAPTGSVDIEAPTVTGSGSDQFGGQDYGTATLASNEEMQRLIDESTRAILENGGYPE